MPFENVEFKTSDHVTLRGWLYTPSSFTGKLPCLVMAPGFGGLKKMGLDNSAEDFVSKLQIACLAYDNRGFGDSDGKESEPPREIIPHQQISDYSDAITFAQSLAEVDPKRIGIWGSSYSGAHVLCVGAIDRRVKVVLSQVPLTSGWENFHRLFRPAYVSDLNKDFEEANEYARVTDRLARAAGKEPRRIPIVHEDLSTLAALPTADSFQAYSPWESNGLVNDVTLKSLEAFRAYEPVAYMHRISPTPLLMVVASNDVVTPGDIATEAFSRAKEPKELRILEGGHFDPYVGESFKQNSAAQVDFLKRYLC